MFLYLSTRKRHCGRTAYLHRKKAVWNRNWTQISSVTLLKEKRGWEMPSRGLQKRLFSARNCTVLSLHSRREKSRVKYFSKGKDQVMEAPFRSNATAIVTFGIIIRTQELFREPLGNLPGQSSTQPGSCQVVPRLWTLWVKYFYM